MFGMVISISVLKTEFFKEPTDHTLGKENDEIEGRKITKTYWSFSFLWAQFTDILSCVLLYVDTGFPNSGPHSWKQLLMEPESPAQKKWFTFLKYNSNNKS